MNNDELNNQSDWLYNDIVKDHFFNPRNYWTEEKYDGADGFGIAGSPVCGDLMKVWIKVDFKTNKIIDCKWQTFGCASAIASTSMMSVIVLENGGMDLEEAKKIDAQKIMDRLGGLPDNKIHCSVLGHLALRNAISDYLKSARDKIFLLENKKEECPGVFTLKFTPPERKNFDFEAGQFVMVQILKEDFSNIGSKAYTISSSPREKSLTITVKRMGAFSNALCDLKAGDKIKITGPYGNFYPTQEMNNLVFLAGGIGISPLYAIIKDLYERKMNKRIILFYSNKSKSDIIFQKKLDEISKDWKNLEIINILTREKETYSDIKEYKRMNVEMIKKYLEDLNGKNYFICGPNDFVIDLRKQLKNAGVKNDCVKIEAFY